MIIIRGDKRVADIYLGEFMRLWQHYRFRYIVNELAGQNEDKNYEPNYLDPTPAWADPYYRAGSVKLLKRKALFRTISSERIVRLRNQGNIGQSAFLCAEARLGPLLT